MFLTTELYVVIKLTTVNFESVALNLLYYLVSGAQIGCTLIWNDKKQTSKFTLINKKENDFGNAFIIITSIWTPYGGLITQLNKKKSKIHI